MYVLFNIEKKTADKHSVDSTKAKLILSYAMKKRRILSLETNISRLSFFFRLSRLAKAFQAPIRSNAQSVILISLSIYATGQLIPEQYSLFAWD